MNLENTLLVTHKNCTDGSGCSLSFMQAGGKRENIIFSVAGQLKKTVKKHNLLEDNRFIIFVDLGVNEDDQDLVEALEKRGNCILLDHHNSSLHLQGRDWCVINMEKCGTMLLREYLRLDTLWLVEFSKIVDDHDRFVRKQLPYSEDLVTFHSSVGQDYFLDRFTSCGIKYRFENYLPTWLLPNEQELLTVLKRRQQEALQDALDNVQFKYVETSNNVWHCVAYSLAPATPNYSVLLHEILNRYPQAQMSCVIHVGRGTVSLSSRGNIDVSEVARRFGGGGHKQAAGHPINKNVLYDFVGNIHNAVDDVDLIDYIDK